MDKNDPNPPLVEPLKAREKEILELISQGKSNREIAESLFLSLNTVKWHNRQIFGKLGVENRNQAVKWAQALNQTKSDDQKPLPKYNLPHPAAPLIGRHTELEELHALLLNNTTRLLTIAAPGGMGKTHLALELTHRIKEHFADGVAFVDLTPVADPETLLPAIAKALHVTFPDQEGEPLILLLNYLREKKLLLLDNFEHLLDSAPILSEIVQTAPDVKLLVTSRDRLKLHVEHTYPLHGLAFSQLKTISEARQDPAFQLFLYHARRLRPSFKLRQHHLDPLQTIVNLVGGMPLALILAAGWIEILSPAEIAAEIGRCLDFLQTTERDIPHRHSSMRAIFDSTWNRLSEPEQAAFAAISIFRGSFTREAVIHVAGTNPQILLKLVERSLVERGDNGRFSIHELLRQFGFSRLAEAPAAENEIRKQHSLYYCGFLHQREEALNGKGIELAESEIAAEIENINTAWRWAAKHREGLIFQAQTALGIFYQRSFRFQEGETAFMASANKMENRDSLPAHFIAANLAWAGYFAGKQSKEKAEILVQQAVDYLKRVENHEENIQAEKAFVLLINSLTQNPVRERIKGMEESISLYEALQKSWQLAWARITLAKTLVRIGNHHQALTHYQEALSIFEKAGDRVWMNSTNLAIARNLAWIGKGLEAEILIRKTITRVEEDGNLLSTIIGRHKLGEVLILTGRFDEALSPLHEVQDRYMLLGAFSRRLHCVYLECMANLHLGRYNPTAGILQNLQDGSQRPGIRVLDYKGIESFIQGGISLALNNPQQAETELHNSLAYFRQVYIQDEAGWAVACLAYVALQTGNIALAETYLVEALNRRLFMTTLYALPAAALLSGRSGRAEQAVEIYTSALQYPFIANSRWFADVASREMAVVRASLPPDVAAAAEARGRAKDIIDTADQLLSELTS